jgi:hypothetical protein
MAKKMDIEKKKCLTPEFRVSYPAVFKAKSFDEQEAKFGLTMLFSKKTDLTALKKAAFSAKVEKWGADKTKWPKKLRSPFRDGAEREGTDGYGENVIFVAATSKTKPGLIDGKKNRLSTDEEFYAGCYARAELLAYAYDTKGNKGVAFGLKNIQKLRDGDPFSGARPAEEVFDEVEDESEDEDNYDDSGEDDEDGDSEEGF